MIQEEKKAAHPIMIKLVTWVCVSWWGFPCTSMSVISPGVTQARVATVSLNKVTISFEHLLEHIICRRYYPKFDARLMRK